MDARKSKTKQKIKTQSRHYIFHKGHSMRHPNIKMQNYKTAIITHRENLEFSDKFKIQHQNHERKKLINWALLKFKLSSIRGTVKRTKRKMTDCGRDQQNIYLIKELYQNYLKNYLVSNKLLRIKNTYRNLKYSLVSERSQSGKAIYSITPNTWPS